MNETMDFIITLREIGLPVGWAFIALIAYGINRIVRIIQGEDDYVL